MPEVDVVIQTDLGEVRHKRLHVDGHLFSIGRHVQNALCLESDLVSREHARVELMDDRMRIEDASSNGTLAGAVLLRHRAIDVPYGTPIKIGRFTLVIGTEQTPQAVSAATRSSPTPATSPAPSAASSNIELRRDIHRKLLENLDLAKLDPAKMDDPSMRPRVLTALRRIVRGLDPQLAPEVDRDVRV